MKIEINSQVLFYVQNLNCAWVYSCMLQRNAIVTIYRYKEMYDHSFEKLPKEYIRIYLRATYICTHKVHTHTHERKIQLFLLILC